MKKIAVVLVVILGLLLGASHAPADGTIAETYEGPRVLVTQTLSLSADATAVALSKDLIGGYLYSVEINSTADDAMTFSIASHLGTTLFTTTTVGAIAGEIATPTAFYPVVGLPTYTLAGLGAGTVTIEVTVVKK